MARKIRCSISEIRGRLWLSPDDGSFRAVVAYDQSTFDLMSVASVKVSNTVTRKFSEFFVFSDTDTGAFAAAVDRYKGPMPRPPSQDAPQIRQHAAWCADGRLHQFR